ncbi:MAG: ABC transporter ATP-binding protein [Endomicrobiia bacterium]|nr:ABC transporter ATP-binding protein [Endomicrobiia bacterium]
MLLISEISKIFRGRRVLDAVSLEIKRATAVSLSGPNGAGKTTLLRIAAGIISPDSGTIEIKMDVHAGGAVSLSKKPQVYKTLTGYVSSDENSFYSTLTARENLEFFAGLRGHRKTPDAVLMQAEAIGAAEYLDTTFAFLSKGTKQKFSFLRSFMGAPEVIFADELDSLDATSRAAADDILKRFTDNGGILVAIAKTRAAGASKHYILEKGSLSQRR